MAFTRAQLVTLVKQLTGNRTNTSNLTDSWYQDRVTSAYRRLCTFQGAVQAPGLRQPQQRKLGFFELEDRQSRTLDSTLTSNFVTPSPSTDVVVVTDLYDRTHDRGLDRRSLREIRTHNPDATGIPRTWCPAGQGGVVGYYINQVPTSLLTTVDAIVVYEYVYKYPTALAADATTPVIPDVWHIAIAFAAASEAALLLDMPEKHTELEGKFIGYIAERKSPMEEAARSGLAGSRRFTPIGMRT
jgi:hypothetical protein